MDPAIFQCLSWSWWGEPLPTRSLCFSTCTAGKWVCSTSVCPGTSDLHLGLYPFPPAPQLLEQGSWGPGLLVGVRGRSLSSISSSLFLFVSSEQLFQIRRFCPPPIREVFLWGPS